MRTSNLPKTLEIMEVSLPIVTPHRSPNCAALQIWASRCTGLVQNSFKVFEGVPGFEAGVVFYESKFDVDQDGSGPKTPGDTSDVDTSLHDANDKALNADEFPFAVLPLRGEEPKSAQDFGLHLADLGIAFWNDLMAAFVYGDLGSVLPQ